MNITEKEYQKMYLKILTDDTRWDLMTAKELEKRLKAYFADKANNDKLIAVMSCMRLADVYYLYQKDGKTSTMPTVPLPEGDMILVFTSKKKIQAESLKQYKTAKSTVYEILNCFESDVVKFVCINAMTDDFILPTEQLKPFIQATDEVTIHVEEQMAEGIKAEELEPIVFERFSGRRIDCETLDGRHIVGDAFSFKNDTEKGQCLVVDIEDGENLDLYQSEVKIIKDITPLEDEE